MNQSPDFLNRNADPAKPTSPQRILLLSAYEAHSHRQWRETLTAMFPEKHWTCLSLPPRHFAWRIRGNSLSWAFNHRELLGDNYDLVIATSLCDLSSLRGFVPALAETPTLVYFHENQFAYPVGDDQHASVEPQIINLYTALCADHIAFNSHWNRDSFLTGVSGLLKKLPDHVPPGLPEGLLARSSVVPVPLPDNLFNRSQIRAPGEVLQESTQEVLQIVWNHRHEYDKGPALLLAIVRELIQRQISFRLHLLGQQFRRQPAEFAQIHTLLSAYCVQQGLTPGHQGWLADRSTYEQVLQQSDIVLSTALHDFQGLSMLEAAALGCLPVAPNALAYPEYFDRKYLYCADARDSGAQAADAVDTLLRIAPGGREPAQPPSVHYLSASSLRADWQTLFDDVAVAAKDLSRHGAKG
jgi:glycosyltransferase involved in cell wall biosynthesis